MPATLTIRRATPSDAPAVAEILARAFESDPVAMWAWPNVADRLDIARAFFRVFADYTIGAGDTLLTDDGGAAIWLPFDPADADDDQAFGEALVAAVGPYADRLAILDDLQAGAHPKAAIHAYLPFIGVVPQAQGLGIGGALLAARTRELDEAGLPGYLEATTLRSVALYERFGFECLPLTLDLPDGPSLYPMWRQPR